LLAQGDSDSAAVTLCGTAETGATVLGMTDEHERARRAGVYPGTETENEITKIKAAVRRPF